VHRGVSYGIAALLIIVLAIFHLLPDLLKLALYNLEILEKLIGDNREFLLV
jgi:hypothetical protein